MSQEESYTLANVKNVKRHILYTNAATGDNTSDIYIDASIYSLQNTEIIIKDVSGVASVNNTITIHAPGGRTINGSNSVSITNPYATVKLIVDKYSDGKNLITI